MFQIKWLIIQYISLSTYTSKLYLILIPEHFWFFNLPIRIMHFSWGTFAFCVHTLFIRPDIQKTRWSEPIGLEGLSLKRPGFSNLVTGSGTVLSKNVFKSRDWQINTWVLWYLNNIKYSRTYGVSEMSEPWNANIIALRLRKCFVILGFKK